MEFYRIFSEIPVVGGPTVAGDSRHSIFQVDLAWMNCSIGTTLSVRSALFMYVDFTIPPVRILLVYKRRDFGLSRASR